jgi:biotin transporter BioY
MPGEPVTAVAADEFDPHSRFHPARWPLAAWVLLALVAEVLRVDYTLGAFSFAPAVALLAGTWLGPRRGALSQAIAVACLAILAVFVPSTASVGEWGFSFGRIAAAWVAGQVAPPTDRGAHPSVRIRLVVMAAAVATIALMITTASSSSGLPGVPEQLSLLFLIAFLVAPAFVVWYAWRIVPQPSRVISYAYSLMPYYALGLAWPWALTRFFPGTAAAAGSLASNPEILFHGYLAHVPGDVIGIVVISYIVCAVNRTALAPPPTFDSEAASD